MPNLLHEFSVKKPNLICDYLSGYHFVEFIEAESKLYLQRNLSEKPNEQEIGRLLLIQGKFRMENVKTIIIINTNDYKWFEKLGLHRIVFLEPK